jgi:hypothetical protein
MNDPQKDDRSIRIEAPTPREVIGWGARFFLWVLLFRAALSFLLIFVVTPLLLWATFALLESGSPPKQERLVTDTRCRQNDFAKIWPTDCAKFVDPTGLPVKCRTDLEFAKRWPVDCAYFTKLH